MLVDQGSIAGSSCICLYTGSVVCNNKGTGSDDDDAVMMDSSSSDDSAPMMGTTGGEEFQIKGLVEVDPVFIATRTTEGKFNATFFRETSVLTAPGATA